MILLIWFVVAIVIVAGLALLFRPSGTRRQQVQFIRETLANSPRSDHPRVIVSLSTVHDRINTFASRVP
jgi:hypothetical protein